MSEKISVKRREEAIYELIINDPENQNRLTVDLSVELIAALESLSTEQELKVLIIRGLKDIFCAGGSLEFLQKIVSGEIDPKHFCDISNALLHFRFPIIAALEGHAVGGGLVLALCCDILIASETSRYGVNFASLGFTPGGGVTFLLPALSGHFFASEMMYTAKLYKGSELKNRGVFNYIVPTEEVFDRSLEIARRISEKPKHVLEMLKSTLSLSRRQGLQTALSYEYLMHNICFNRKDIAALIEASYLS